MTKYIQKRHGSIRTFLLNLLLLGLAGALLLNAFTYVFYSAMPNSYYIQFNEPTLVNVCTHPDGRYAIQSEIHREIYPSVPDRLKQNRNLPAEAIVEIRRENREIDRIDVGKYVYQWELEHRAYTQNDLNVILIPCSYTARSYITITLPNGQTRQLEPSDSRTFKVPDDIPACN